MLLASEYLCPSTISQYLRERGLPAGIWCCVTLGKSLLSGSGIYIPGSRGSGLGLQTLVLGLTPERAESRRLPTPTERWILVQSLCLGVREKRDPWPNFGLLIQQSWCLTPLSPSSKAQGGEVGQYPVEAQEWRGWPEPHSAEWSLGCLGEEGEAMGLR